MNTITSRCFVAPGRPTLIGGAYGGGISASNAEELHMSLVKGGSSAAIIASAMKSQ